MIYFISNKDHYYSKDIERSSVKHLLEYFKEINEIQVDTETEGFFNHKNRILLLQLGTFEDQFVLDFQSLTFEEKEEISDKILNNPEKLKLFHNSKFDIKFLWFEGLKICCIYDTMLAECILNAGKELIEGYYSLKETTYRYCNITLDKEIRGIIHREGFTERVVKYAANDVKYLADIKKCQLPILISLELGNENTQDIHTVLGLENNVVLPFAEIEYYGIKVDTDKWTEVRHLIDHEKDKILQELNSEVVSNKKLSKFWRFHQDLFTEVEPVVTVNWNSPQQKSEVLKELGEFKSTDQRELEKHKRKFKLVDLLIKYNKINKLSTAFANKLEKFINPYTKRVHTEFWQILDTGRVSCSNPNLQQIPARTELGGKMRECFVAEEGYKMVGGDFSGCELRIIAEYSGDEVWLESFKNDEDLHSKLCSLTFNIPIEDVKKSSHFKPDLKYRDIQKTINFGLAYGMSEYKLADTIEIEVSQAREIINKFFTAVPKVKEFLDMLGTTAKTKGRIKTPPPYKRIRWFEGYDSNDFKILGGIERAGKNTPIQGGNADLTKLALVNIYREIHSKNLPVRIIHTVHDEIQCEVKEEYAQEWAITMEKIMRESGKIIVKTIPMKVDCKISNCWSK